MVFLYCNSTHNIPINKSIQRFYIPFLKLKINIFKLKIKNFELIKKLFRNQPEYWIQPEQTMKIENDFLIDETSYNKINSIDVDKFSENRRNIYKV